MKRTLPALLLVAAFALTSCGAEKEAKVKSSDDTPAKVIDSGSPDADDSDKPKETAPLGSTVEVGDWDVTVTKVVLNAAPQIAQANQFNDKAKGQYVLVLYSATYTGDERTADVDADLTWSFTGSDNQVNDEASQVTPADNTEQPTEARKGGTVKQQALFDIDPALIQGGLLTVEAYDDDFDEVYADFAIS